MPILGERKTSAIDVKAVREKVREIANVLADANQPELVNCDLHIWNLWFELNDLASSLDDEDQKLVHFVDEKFSEWEHRVSWSEGEEPETVLVRVNLPDACEKVPHLSTTVAAAHDDSD